MSHEFDAIYERGVFRPLERVDLPDQTKVHLQIQEAVEGARVSLADEASAQKAALRELVGWVHGRPSLPAEERVSARDHDRILYGWQK
jgi:predicted DNA-binding antitoxin AbrB/MazE fold protein